MHALVRETTGGSGLAAVLTPDGTARTADDDGGVYVLAVSVALELSGALVCDWRDGDVR